MNRYISRLVFVAVVVWYGNVRAQVRGEFRVSETDAGDVGTLILRGTTGNDASVLWASDTRGRLVLLTDTVDGTDYEETERRVFLTIDGTEQAWFVMRGAEADERIRLSVFDDSDRPFIRLSGPEDSTAGGSRKLVEIGSTGWVTARGAIDVYGVDTDDAPFLMVSTYGAGDGGKVWVRGLPPPPPTDPYYVTPIPPEILLDGGTGNIYKTGDSAFVLRDPATPGKWIVYAAAEGPEAGVYLRGTANLVNGQATVPLADHFAKVASAVGLTVQVTPLSAASRGLAVVGVTPTELRVRELFQAGAGAPPPGIPSGGSYAFGYIVMGVRKGRENFQVVRDAPVLEGVAAGQDADEIGDDSAAAAEPQPPPGPPVGPSPLELLDGIQRLLQDEITDRIVAVHEVSIAIAQEISQRIAAFQMLFEAIAAEAEARAAEDAAIRTEMAEEKSARIQADESFSAELTATLDAAKTYTDSKLTAERTFRTEEIAAVNGSTLTAAQVYCDEQLAAYVLRGCPEGFVAVGSVCIGPAVGAGSWNDAAATCVLGGFKLCSEAELVAAAQAGAYDTAAYGAWVDATCGDGLYKYEAAAGAALSDDFDACGPGSDTHTIVCCADR